MDGSVNPSELATLSLLGRGGIGVGAGGYGYGYGGGREFANDSSNAVRINRNEKLATQGHDFISQQISDNADRNRDLARQASDNAQYISNRDFQTQIGFNLANQFARGEDNQNANFNMLSREASANAREAAKCCCETQKLITAEGNETRALILAVEGRATVADLAAAQAKITQLETINALSRGHHGG